MSAAPTAAQLRLKGQIWLACALLLAVLLAGCAPAAASAPTAVATALPPSATPVQPQPSATQAPPTATAAPASTLTATLAPTLTPIPSPAPSTTPEEAFEQAKVTGVRNQVGGVLVTIKLPNLRSPYNIILAGVKYSCSLDAQYPGLLFCWGLAAPPLNKTLNLAFLDPASGQVVREVQTFLAEADFPPSGAITNNSENCALKGQNQTCEVECRIDENGDPCIVASCYDACGQTLSVQTCSSNLENISFCTAEQLQEIKQRYNIP